jgi:hypothetical protein
MLPRSKLPAAVLSHGSCINCIASAPHGVEVTLSPNNPRNQLGEFPVLSFPQPALSRLTYGQEFLKVEIMSFTLHLSTSLPAAGALSLAALLLRA